MKLLVVKLQAIGDLVIATPALRRLRDGLPDAKIELLTTGWCEPVLRHSPLVDRMIVVAEDLFFKSGINTLRSTIGLIRGLRSEHYDAAIIFHRHRMIHRFIKMVGIPKVFYFDYENRRNSVLLDENRHSTLTACELADLAVRNLGGDVVESPDLSAMSYEWHLQPQELASAGNILQEYGLKAGDFVVILPGGGVNPSVSNTVKRWHSDRFGELGARLHKDFGLSIMLLGGDTDRETASRVEQSCTKGAVNLCGKVDLRLTAALMRLSRLVICNDSGPLHIAAAVGAPVVAIFGPTSENHKLPPGDDILPAALDLPCRPCYFGTFKGCIFERIRCMDELSVDQVMAVAASLIKRTQSGQT